MPCNNLQGPTRLVYRAFILSLPTSISAGCDGYSGYRCQGSSTCTTYWFAVHLSHRNHAIISNCKLHAYYSPRTIRNYMVMVCANNQVKLHPSDECWNLGYTSLPIVTVKNGAHLLGPFFSVPEQNIVKTKWKHGKSNEVMSRSAIASVP